MGKQDPDVVVLASVMRTWEDNLRKSFVSSSVLEASLTGLSKLLGECALVDDLQTFVFHDNIDATAVRACLSAISVSSRHASQTVASSYANLVIARRRFVQTYFASEE